MNHHFARGWLTDCVTGRWAGVDAAWEQYKFGARKMLENGDESHLPKHSGGVHALFGGSMNARLAD